VISFLLELLLFAILAYYGFHAAENSADKYLLAFSLPLAAAVLLLHKMGQTIFSICLSLVILINKILSYLWKQ
jgi:hypothetical protein